MDDDFEFDLDAELLQEQQLREEMEMDMEYLEAQEHEGMIPETDPGYTVRGEHIDHLEEGDEPEASGTSMRTPLRTSLAKRPRLESPAESPYKSPTLHMDMASIDKMRARSHLFSHAVELATEHEGVLQIPCQEQLRSKPLLGENCITTVLADGSRYFVKMLTEDEAVGARSAAAAEQKAKVGLLSQSMRELSKEAERLRIESLTKSKKNSIVSTSDMHSNQQKHLWVEKYAPKSFSQLLSSEQINRDVLRGLKQWDAYVFGSAPDGGVKRPTPRPSSGDLRPPIRAILLSGPAGTGKTTLAHVAARHCGYRPMELNASDDRSAEALTDMIGRACNGNSIYGDKRPNCIILDEIDGIDGRGSIDALIEIIKTPLGSGKGKKGSSLALTRPLICICNDLYSPQLRELRKHAQVFQFSSPTEARLIQRLKAVCVAEGIQVSSGALNMLCAATGHDIRSSINTLQFASLRSHQIAGQQSANPASRDIGSVLASMISSGLKDSDKDIFQIWREIFNFKEAAKSYARKSTNTPSLFADNADNSTNEYSASAQQSVSGRTSRSVTSIDVSALQSIRASVDGSSLISKSQSDGKGGHALDIMQAVMNYGDNQSVLIGVFENYLSMRYHDPSMSRTSSAADWLCVSDMFSGDGSAHFATDMYAPLGASAIHVLCASDSRVNIMWPKKDANMKFLWHQRSSIVQTLIEGACTSTSQAMRQNKSVVLDVIPYLVDLISPAVRSVGFASLSTRELEKVRAAAHVMASCGVKYEYQTSVLTNLLMSGAGDADASKEGAGDDVEGSAGESTPIIDASVALPGNGVRDQSLFRLEPPVTELLTYSNIPELMNRRPTIGPELKNVLYVETQKVILSSKNQVSSTQLDAGASPHPASAASPSLTRKEEPAAAPPIQQPAPLTTAAPAQAPRKTGFDFFGKAPSTSAKRPAASMTTNATSNYKKDANKTAIRFKFSQGFSAAVKRPVSISEFL